jgi:hypothetical protein
MAWRHADNGLRYQIEDDGTVQNFAKDFDGIGRFGSPSIGKVIPGYQVSGPVLSRQDGRGPSFESTGEKLPFRPEIKVWGNRIVD